MKILLTDCSVLLNLLAAGCLPDLTHATGWQFAICPSVRDEVKKLRDAHTLEMVEVDLRPLIASGLLQVLELSGETEEKNYIELSRVVDDGEAMSIAISANRFLELAIDDKQAANHIRRFFPDLRIWSTPEILKHWAEKEIKAATDMPEVIRLIEIRARYFPPKSHPLAAWWQESKK